MTSLMQRPWQDISELALIKDWFFGLQSTADPYTPTPAGDMRKEAVARVNIWSFKTTKLPPAVVATADLVDSILQHEARCESQDQSRYRSTQFMFAFAFLRFVNGFVDRDTIKSTSSALAISEDEGEEVRAPKGVGESSMYAHAATIGMPIRFVDLRHQVAHGEVPELSVLKKATEEALSWLYEKWWRPQATGNPLQALERHQNKQTRWSERKVDVLLFG